MIGLVRGEWNLMLREVARFTCIDHDGVLFRVAKVIIHGLREQSLPAFYELEDGRLLDKVDDFTFRVVRTGQVLRRV